MTEAVHAELSASGSAKWLACPASVSAERGIPNPDNEFSLYGSAAHALAEECLREELLASFFKGYFAIKADEKHDFFISKTKCKINSDYKVIDVDDEMIAGVQIYLDYCNNLDGQEFWIEKKVFFGDTVPGQWGTADYIKIKSVSLDQYDEKLPHYVVEGRKEIKVINVVDLKFGKGIKVYAQKNSQAMLYALGVYNEYYFMYEFDDDDIFNIVIVQPRLDHIDEFAITVGELLTWAHGTVKLAAEKAMADDLEFIPGEHCSKGFCRAQSTCKALAEFNMKAVYDDFNDIESSPGLELKDIHKLSNIEVGILLKQRKTCEKWWKELANYAYTQVMAGEEIFEHKLVQGNEGNRKIDDPEAIADWIMSHKLLKKKGDLYDKQLKSPAQLEKAIKANGKETVIEFDDGSKECLGDFLSRPPGAKTLVHISDKREAAELNNDVEDDFNDTTEGK